MNLDEIKFDTRVIAESRKGQRGTIRTLVPNAFGEDRTAVGIEYDNGGFGYNWPEQLTPLDEPAPAPKLGRALNGVSTFWFNGTEWCVYSTSGAGDMGGFFSVGPYRSTPASSEATLVNGARTRKRAFEIAVDKLTARKLVRIKPRPYGSVTVDEPKGDLDERPELLDADREGWVAAWTVDSVLFVYENGVERGLVWADRPIEVYVTADGKSTEVEGSWAHCEAGVLAVYNAHTSR